MVMMVQLKIDNISKRHKIGVFLTRSVFEALYLWYMNISAYYGIIYDKSYYFFSNAIPKIVMFSAIRTRKPMVQEKAAKRKYFRRSVSRRKG